MRYDIVLLLLLLPPSSVRSAKPKATGTAQKGIRGYFAQVVKTQQNADDDAAHDISDDGTAKTKDSANEEKQCAQTPVLPTQPYDVTPGNLAKDGTNEENAHDDADRNRRYAYSSNRLFILSHHSYPYYHITNTMRSTEGSGSHWVAVVVEIEKKNSKVRGNSGGSGNG